MAYTIAGGVGANVRLPLLFSVVPALRGLTIELEFSSGSTETSCSESGWSMALTSSCIEATDIYQKDSNK
jgi:hypothetical protein